MIGNARTRAGDTLAYRHPVHLGSNRDYRASGRIAGRQSGIELALDLPVNAGDALFTHQLNDTLDMMRLFEGSTIKRQAGHFDPSHFRADAHAGALDPDQHVLGTDNRRRNFFQENLSRPNQQLFHDQTPRVSITALPFKSPRGSSL